jgi:hypothetical protein
MGIVSVRLQPAPSATFSLIEDGTMQPTIHLIDGSGGGRGKSLFTCAMAHYAQLHQYPIQLFDADEAHRYNVKKFYPEAIALVLSEIEYQDLDQLWNAIERGLIPVVNLPAGSHSFVSDWFERNGLLGLTKEGEPIRLVKWFLCNPSPQTLTLFEQSLDDYANDIDHVVHIFVRNLHLATDRQWREFTNTLETTKSATGKPWQSVFESPQVRAIDFPKFPPYERDHWDGLGWTLAKAIAPSEQFHLLERQRIATFLKHFAQAIDSTQIWDNIPTQSERLKQLQAAQLQEKTKASAKGFAPSKSK